MSDVGGEIKSQRNSLGLSVARVARRAEVSPASIKRVEANDPTVTAVMRSRVIQALADVAAERAAVRLGSDGATSLADQVERHALALMEVARKLRGQPLRKPVGAPPLTPPGSAPQTLHPAKQTTPP